MKSKKRIVTAVITGIAAVAAFACGIVLSACNSGESNGQTKILEVPENLQIADEYLTWDEVAEAVSYVVEVNGEEYTTTTNSLDIMEITNEPASYTFAVSAVGDHEKTYDSDWSLKLRYNVYMPENLVYKQLADGNYEVSAATAASQRDKMTGKLIIPYEYKGIRVTSIATSGFRQCENITSVYIPDSVEMIDEGVFMSCTSMTRIRMPKNLNSIPMYTFKDCSALKEVKCPDKLTYIDFAAFEGCSALEKAELNEGLTSIKSKAFAGCTSLKALTLPQSLESLGYQDMIDECDSLKTLEVANGENNIFKSENNCIIRKSNNALVLGCNGSVIPDYVTEIGFQAFSYCRTISEIVIPNSVKKIGVAAFEGCNNITSITLPEGLEEVTTAFTGCEKLESVYISSTVADLGPGNIFRKCPNLKSIEVAENNPVYKSENNCVIRKSDNVLVIGCAGSVIPDYIKVIGTSAFKASLGLEKIVIPNGVTEIQANAFAECHDAREIYIPKSIKIIGEKAFAYCCYASVVIPDSVQTIGNNAFEGHCKAYSIYDNKLDLNSPLKDKGMYRESVLAYDEDGIYPYVYSTILRNPTFNSGVIGNDYDAVMIAPCRQGYTFLGWALEEGSNQVVYKPEIVSVDHKDYDDHDKIIIVSSENVLVTYFKDYNRNLNGTVLYAVWEKNN